jgi:hypothetical protein
LWYGRSGGHRVVVVDDRQDARAERNVRTGQPLRIALAVPPLVVAHDERCHGIGERHSGDDLGADLRVDADLLELLRRERPGLRQNVLRDREIADVVQQCRGLDALNLRIGQPQLVGEPGRVDLHAADVHLRRLILASIARASASVVAR